jgi:hypothetical protein
VKTTIDFPEDVLKRAKILAIQKNTSFRELVIAGLQAVIASNDSASYANEELVSALSKGRNTKPVGQLRREEIYDRTTLH